MRKAAVLSLLCLAACHHGDRNNEAVRQGVVDYLAASKLKLNMDAMDANVTSVSFEKDVARAAVAFVVKGQPGGGGMNMDYVLDRKGDKWVVRGKQVSPGNAHGAEALPQGHPPAGSP